MLIRNSILVGIYMIACFTGCSIDSRPQGGHSLAAPIIELSDSESNLVKEAVATWDREQEARIQEALLEIPNPCASLTLSSSLPGNVDPNLVLQIVRQMMRGCQATSARVNRELVGWSPPAVGLRLCAIEPGGNLIGEWEKGGGHQGEWLKIKQVAPNLYAIRFGSWDCMEQLRLDRAARIVRGMLVLDRPVREHRIGATYNVMFIMGRQGEVNLVPLPYVDGFVLSEAGSDDLPHHSGRFVRSTHE
jgi:hypothetical protein